MTLELIAAVSDAEVKLRAESDNALTQTIEVYRQMRGATAQVRGPSDFANHIWVINDIEILFNTPITYEAYARNEAGTVIESATAGPVTIVKDTAYLRNVLVASAKMPVRLVGQESGDYESEVRRELLRPLGRSAPVVITDIRSSATGASSILTRSAAEARQLDSLLASGDVLMFTGPVDWDLRWPIYMHPGTASEKRVGAALSEDRIRYFEWVQVDPPPYGLFESVQATTWQDLLTAGKTWGAIRSTSWNDLMYPPPVPVILRGP